MYRVRDVLKEIMGRDERFLYEVKWREALSAWEKVSEDFVRNHTRAVQVKNRKLLIHTDSPVLANELSMREGEYVKRINDTLGANLLEGLVFMSGRIPSRKREEGPPAEGKRRISQEVKRRIRRMASRIRDGDLRAAMESFLDVLARRNG